MNEQQDKPNNDIDNKNWYLGNIRTSPDILLAWIRGQAERKFLKTKSFRLDDKGNKFQLFLHNEDQLFEGIITYEWGWVEISQASDYTSQITIVAETKYIMPVEQVEERGAFFDWILEMIKNTWDCSIEHQSTNDLDRVENDDKQVMESSQSLPKWWPQKTRTKSKWKRKYVLMEKDINFGETNIRLAKKYNIDRKTIGHIIEWAKSDPDFDSY